jgi:FixJ family two-component response regulator
VTDSPRLPRELTPRQRQIAVLLRAGLAPKKIGSTLGVSLSTVRFHIRALAARLPGDAPAQRKILTVRLPSTFTSTPAMTRE